MGLEKQFDMATNAKDKFPALTLMQCGESEESKDYLVLIRHSNLGIVWRVDTWSHILHTWSVYRNVIAWQPIPPIPTEQELEHLYKIPISNDE